MKMYLKHGSKPKKGNNGVPSGIALTPTSEDDNPKADVLTEMEKQDNPGGAEATVEPGITDEAIAEAEAAKAKADAQPKPVVNQREILDTLVAAGHLSAEAAEALGGSIAKAEDSEKRSKVASALTAFNSVIDEGGTGLEITAEMVGKKFTLPEFIQAVADLHQADLTDRKVVVLFPKGDTPEERKPKVLNTPISKRSNGDGSGRSFPNKYQNVTIDEKQTDKSPTAIAFSLGYQVRGRRDMMEVFNSPEKFKSENAEGQREKLTPVYKCEADMAGKTFFRLTTV